MRSGTSYCDGFHNDTPEVFGYSELAMRALCRKKLDYQGVDK